MRKRIIVGVVGVGVGALVVEDGRGDGGGGDGRILVGLAAAGEGGEWRVVEAVKVLRLSLGVG
jgi:hypothetical protein